MVLPGDWTSVRLLVVGVDSDSDTEEMVLLDELLTRNLRSFSARSKTRHSVSEVELVWGLAPIVSACPSHLGPNLAKRERQTRGFIFTRDSLLPFDWSLEAGEGAGALVG